MRRVRTIAGHVHGNGEGPLWAALMDSGHDPLAKPRLGCRCSADKWQYVCNCYPCLLRAGREEDFEWTPGMIDARPASLPWQWRRAEGSLSVGACSDLPKDPPSKQEPLVTEEHAGVVRLRRDGQPAPLGPAAPSVHPRFAGIATFARLPQLHELRSFVGAVSETRATLEVRSSASGAAESTVCLSGPWHDVGSSTLSLPVTCEDGCVHIRSAGGQKTLGLWALPSGRWHRVSGAVDLRLTRLPREQFDIAFLGVPFDSGCSFRPGARFGPEAIRSNSRLIRPYMITQQQRPLLDRQVVDTGDASPTPFNIQQAVEEIHAACRQRLEMARRLVVVGGDHTLSYPVIKAVAEKFGPVVLGQGVDVSAVLLLASISLELMTKVHFDSHLDTFPPMLPGRCWSRDSCKNLALTTILSINKFFPHGMVPVVFHT
ncbi:gbh [Symbiodinium sp. CCMP2592]|nr:gbh [Symbiodinium sp. CCMP2592]